MTFKGAVVGCTPSAAGARGRARCRKDPVPTAMLGRYISNEGHLNGRSLIIKFVKTPRCLGGTAVGFLLWCGR